MHRVEDIRSFYEFIGYVIGYAPNRFSVQDFLASHEQMKLAKAFDQLRRGLEISGYLRADSSAEQLLQASLAAYQAGDEITGAHVLQEMEAVVFKKRRI